jgi:NAD(P) transhydrogenase subunit beta
MSADLAALAYLVAGGLFILALRGLSNPETSRRGNLFGMIGMVIAVATTLASHPPAGVSAWVLVVAGMALGGGAGAVIARRVPMTSMPELVAAFHSLVGMAAVLVAAGALYAPAAFDIGTVGAIHRQSLIEMSLGVAIGAVTFTGSVIAFLKLSGRMSGAPIILPLRHVINIALAVLLVALIVWFFEAQHYIAFWLIAAVSFLLGVLIIVPIGGADMPVVISMLNSYSGWAAAGIGFTLGNSALIITGALVGSSGAILSYIMCKGMTRGGGRRPPGQDRIGGGCRLYPEKRRQSHHRARLRDGGGAGAARVARDGGKAQSGGRRDQIRHSSGGRPHAGTYERAVGRGQCAV